MIRSPDDFLNSNDGLDRMDGIAMMLIAIGENIKKIDKIPRENCWQVILKHSSLSILFCPAGSD
jgi:hypothetical protein